MFTGDRYAIIGGTVAVVLGAGTRALVGTVYLISAIALVGGW